MTPEEFEKYEAANAIDVDFTETEEMPSDEKPEAPDIDTNWWVCTCGTSNKGKFCLECGKEKPHGIPQYRCDKCGWEPEDRTHPPKHCPECGDIFDDGDIILV